MGLAGFFGTLARHFSVRAVNHLLPGFPWGTLCVNVAGAFLAGFLFIWGREKFQEYEHFMPIIFIGFLGAFTTFSTFALESARFFMDGQYSKMLLNIALQNITGLSAAICGIWVCNTLTK